MKLEQAREILTKGKWYEKLEGPLSIEENNDLMDSIDCIELALDTLEGLRRINRLQADEIIRLQGDKHRMQGELDFATGMGSTIPYPNER